MSTSEQSISSSVLLDFAELPKNEYVPIHGPDSETLIHATQDGRSVDFDIPHEFGYNTRISVVIKGMAYMPACPESYVIHGDHFIGMYNGLTQNGIIERTV